LTACIHVKVWKAEIDQQVEFESIQRKAITKEALKEQVKRVKRQAKMTEEEGDEEARQQMREELEISNTYISKIMPF